MTYLIFASVVFTFRSKLKQLSLGIIAISLLALMFLAPKNMDVTYDYGLIRCLSGFFVGVFICLWRNQSLNINFNKGSVIELFVIVLVYLFISELGANKYSLLSPLVFGFAVWIFSYELGYISKILKHKFIQQLGVLSFTMYMIHSVILTVIWRVNTLLTKNEYIVESENAHGYGKIMHFGNPYLGDLFLICYIGFVIIVSSIIYKKYEEPLRIKFNQFANRKF
jgi:peptidoglycan/LPS O-acetylase OafA/YrhL